MLPGWSDRPVYRIGMIMQFMELGLSERMALSLLNLDLKTPTEIQTKVIPQALDGRDIMASAETGSGKTAAYALPIIHEHEQKRKQVHEQKKEQNYSAEKIKSSKSRKPTTLVMVPTRELAIQVESQFKRFSGGSGLKTVCIYGGTGYERQLHTLNRGVDVIVATPGRLFDHISRNSVDLSMIEMLILDEADRMLDMGFMPQVRKIVARVPEKRQTLMFSATIGNGIEQAASEFLSSPRTIRVNKSRIEPTSIEQKVYNVDESGKEALLMQLLTDNPDVNSVLVFTRTRHKATKLRKKLCEANVKAEEIHGSISQNKRERTLARYRKGLFSVLVATDIAARGLDIPEISHVVNYDLPDSAEDYVHRIGRTGRAGRKGVALTFISPQQRHLIRAIEQVTGSKLGNGLPDDKPKNKTRNRPSENRAHTARPRHNADTPRPRHKTYAPKSKSRSQDAQSERQLREESRRNRSKRRSFQKPGSPKRNRSTSAR